MRVPSRRPSFSFFHTACSAKAALKLFVIVDNLPVHRVHRVTVSVRDNADCIELVDPPPHSTEH